MNIFIQKIFKLIPAKGRPMEVGPPALPDMLDIVKSKPTESDLLASLDIEQSRLTETGLLASLVVQFTGRCNLRCVYCPQGTDLNTHNNDDAEEKLLYEVAGYIEEQQIDSVHLGVYGETLIYDGWPGIAESYLQANASLTMTTNLAKHLSDEELHLLSRFKLIFVSIDTLDLPLLKKIRTVDGRLILYNFHLVRAWAIQHGQQIPDFAWSCTLSTDAIAHLEDMLPLANRYGVKYLFLNDLSSYEGLKHGLKNVFELEGSEFDMAAATLDRVLAFCARAGIQIHAPWKERLDKEREKRKNGSGVRMAADTADTTQLLRYNNIQGAAVWYSEALAPGMTRMCMQPWNSMVVMPKGEIYTCCQRGVSMGRVNSSADFDDVRNGPEYVDLRRQLITGRVTDETCRNCQTMPATTPDKLIEGVRNLLASKDAKQRQ